MLQRLAEPLRILGRDHPVRERRDQLLHPVYAKPALVATPPHQRWSWYVTRLVGSKRWRYYYLLRVRPVRLRA